MPSKPICLSPSKPILLHGGENMPENFLNSVIYGQQLETTIKCYEESYK